MRYLFEGYAFDTVRRELHRGADVISVAPQVFDLLDYLIRNRERVVSKDDLIAAIWNGRTVSDAALTTRLNVARNVIGDTGEEQRLIKTLPRKGFRFVAPVVEERGPANMATVDNAIEQPKPALALPNKPSIAVLPFTNLSGDPEQDYFADGMVDEITTALSRFKSLFVIARNSSFTYKGRAVDIKQVGRELGVRYVLEGSVRKAGGKVRIAGQLIDATTGAHLWADRFEGDLSDVFALQDEVTVNVVSVIQPRLLQTEMDIASRRPNNLSAHDLCLRAQHVQSWTREGSAESLRLVSRALEIDPRCGFAATLAGECHFRNARHRWEPDQKAEIAEGFRLLRLALTLDGNATLALSMLGRATASFSGDFETAKEMVDRAVSLNPNSFRAWEERGWTYVTAGQPEEAIRSFERRIRLSPFDPLLFATNTGMSVAFNCLGRFDDAVATARKAIRQNPLFPFSYRCLASALAHLGHDAEAEEAVARLLELDPDFRISERVARGDMLKLQVYIDGLRKAGLPD
ncbi:tetratricopeptide repeat protein [Bradyrhizobium manausense]|uniref:winged helix-turn-helix domain-containing tetratricopeptide repeat protein n=1 Tax=Bradyrhizobium TaxID=374 RepID=UPI001BA890CF|nr:MULTISPECIES: tetratricopeptide repeat protein [Bradyrhizobium]MBR0827277.1 tetratricopeptide repeat protein [Bradyrhizobium manausense]UVO27243.1 tetratricopeptide repeat protein [Bradyrhizobium arachidis]